MKNELLMNYYLFIWNLAEEPESTVEDNDATEANESCDDDEEDEDEKVQDIIGPSDAMKELLRALEFSAIDIYR